MTRRVFMLHMMSALAIFAAADVFAHDDHGKPQYGGVVAEGGFLQAELVFAPNKATIYLTDHGKPVSSKGATAKLTILVAGKRSELSLAPSGQSQLEAALTTPIPKDARVVGVVTVAGQKPVSLRWVVR